MFNIEKDIISDFNEILENEIKTELRNQLYLREEDGDIDKINNIIESYHISGKIKREYLSEVLNDLYFTLTEETIEDLQKQREILKSKLAKLSIPKRFKRGVKSATDKVKKVFGKAKEKVGEKVSQVKVVTGNKEEIQKQIDKLDAQLARLEDNTERALQRQKAAAKDLFKKRAKIAGGVGGGLAAAGLAYGVYRKLRNKKREVKESCYTVVKLLKSRLTEDNKQFIIPQIKQWENRINKLEKNEK